MRVIKKKKSSYIKWLYPGLGVKRWLFIALLGLGVAVIGIWNLINNQYTRDVVIAFVNWLEVVLPSMGFYHSVLCVVGGIVLIIAAIYCLVRQYLKTTLVKSQSYYEAKTLQQGPKIVVIGGGTGLSVLLRGLKEYSSNITAVVSVADDGGSSGRLREQYNVVPVGDIRNCIVALADEEDVMEELFSYRFDSGDELDGHSLGNLLLVAMSHLKGGFQDAVADIDQVLHIRGRVIPVAAEAMTLKAELEDGTEIIGESNIADAWLPIRQLKICPTHVEPLPEVLEALDEAEAIILGPGSLYSSIIPNLLVDGVVAHIKESNAMKFYICNVMTQPGETAGYTAQEHLRQLMVHSTPDIVDHIVLNEEATIDQVMTAQCENAGVEPVRYDRKAIEDMGVKVIAAPLLDQSAILHHDARKLAHTIMASIYKDKAYRARRGRMKSFWDSKNLQAKWQQEE